MKPVISGIEEWKSGKSFLRGQVLEKKEDWTVRQETWQLVRVLLLASLQP